MFNGFVLECFSIITIVLQKQEKYERELVFHVKDVEELVKVKEQVGLLLFDFFEQ